MIDSQYIFPATLSALTILATVLNFTAHFSNGEYLSWKAFYIFRSIPVHFPAAY